VPSSATQPDGWPFCDGILPDVSRSFALIIPRCPEPIDRALCVAYLICRIVDTIEDDPSLSDEQRPLLYDAFLSAFEEPEDKARTAAFIAAWPAIPEDAYGRLIRGTRDVLAAFGTLPANFQTPIRACVRDMTGGMRAVRAVETVDGIRFMCRDLSELEQYCHYVAGVVGIMSTALFQTRFDAGTFTPTPEWREQGRHLGLGLQMTNIIKDFHVDGERGVSFIPARYVDFTQPAQKLLPEGRTQLIRQTITHLDAGLRYVCGIPGGETGIRAFLLGSLLPAIATLEKAASGTEHHPKIDRAKMAEIFTLIDRRVSDDGAFTCWYDEHRDRALATARQAQQVLPRSFPRR